jgi:hypothetical protein
MKILASLLLLLCSWTAATAQQSVAVENVRVEAPYTHFFSGNKGLRLKVDVQFVQYVEAYLGRSYKLHVVLVDAGGFAVFDSRNSYDFPVGVVADKPALANPKVGMEGRDVEIFIPYKLINLPTGKQTVTAVFSLKNDYQNYPDFSRKSITFAHTKIDIKTLDQQKFTVKGPDLRYGVPGFGETKPGMNVQFNLGMQYGGDQVETEAYLLHLTVRTPDGKKLLYTTRDEKFNPHAPEKLYSKDFPGDAQTKDFFIPYRAMLLDAPGDVQLTLEIEETGKGLRQLYQKVLRFDTPPKYRYDQQVFTPSNVKAGRGLLDGVSGVQIGFDCAYKFNGPLIDAERGDFYYFAVLTGEKGDTVFSPAVLKRMDYGTTVGWSGHDPELDSTGSAVQLYIPLHRLRLKPGVHTLNYTVLVTDRARKARFPVIAKGQIQLEQPVVLTYDLQVQQLEVIPGEYDVEVAIFSSPLPDLEWRLEVGEDTEYQSPTATNSLLASPGSHRIKLAQGDELFLGLWDIDSGFFNRNDALGRWKIPYEDKGDSFLHTLDTQGAIKTLRLQVTRVR